MKESKDDYIRKKFLEDDYIPDKVNEIFENFKVNISKNILENIDTNNIINGVSNDNQTSKTITDIANDSQAGRLINNNANDNQAGRIINKKGNHNEISTAINNNSGNNQINGVINGKSNNKKANEVKNESQNVLFYRKMNRYLCVAAVFLCIVLVGTGTLLYNRKPNVENINIVTTRSAIVKNEELKVSNKQILEYSENDLIKACLLDDRKVAIQLKEKFIKLYNLNLSSEKQYEVNNITKNVRSIFVGYLVNNKYPGVMLVMEDGTAECIQIFNGGNVSDKEYEFDFYSQKINGLYDVVAFSQGNKYFYNSDDVYYYVSAIRKDGKKKIIELDTYNDWNDNVDDVYNNLNEKYILEGNNINNLTNNTISNSTTNDSTLNNTIANNNVQNNNTNGVNDNSENSHTNDKNSVNNINSGSTNNNESNNYVNNNNINNNANNSNMTSNNVSNSNNNTNQNVTNHNNTISQSNINTSITNYNNEIVSEFERRVKDSNDYYREGLTGHYCLKKSGDNKSAYNIQDSQLFRYNIEQDNISWVASGVNDLYKDDNGNLICKLQENYSIKDSDYNIIYNEFNVTDSEVITNYENEIVKIEQKLDGSLTIQILQGGLQKLGISSSETLINENVKYNLYGKSFGVSSNKNGYEYANAQKGILGFVGKTNRLNFAYANGNNTVVCIDILDAICNGSFEEALCTGISNFSPVVEFRIDEVYNKNSSSTDESETFNELYYKVIENNNEYNKQIVTYYDFRK